MKKILRYIKNKILWHYNLWRAIKIGGNIIIEKSCNVSKYSNIFADGLFIKLGEKCTLHPYSYLRLHGGSIEIGNNVYINPYTVIYGHGGLKIGNNVLIAAHCTIIPSNHNFENIDAPIVAQGETCKGIVIEDDVWLGTGVKVLDGVTIGCGSVIGAGSVVTKSIPSYSVAVGAPAKVIKKRKDLN